MYERRTHISIALTGLALLSACGASPEGQQAPPEPADIIFIGDNIVTMDGTEATGVAVVGDRIAAVGPAEEILERRTSGTRVVDLGDHALLPGFIDAHGHVAVQARLINLVNLSSPPVGTAKSIAGIQKLLREEIAAKNIPPGQWVIGYGYDESLLSDQRHPTRDDLDAVSANHPILLAHVSFHLAAMNSAALTVYKYDAATADPAGGRIQRRAGTQEPNGVLEEATAQRPMLERILVNDGFEDELRKTLDLYASYGVTTAQDGGAMMRDVAMMREAAAREPLPIDLVAYPLLIAMTEEQRADLRAEDYAGGFRVGGGKFVLDGSIQGKTGYLTEPYFETPEGEDADYRGYPAMPAETFQTLSHPFFERGVPLLIHANGDAAIDMMLEGVSDALGEQPRDHRTVMIHAQMMRDDQIDRTKALGVIPSYFSAHPFFWGDWHRKILGEERASRISPIRTTIEKGVPFTVHNDSPIIPPDMMRLLWVTVNRKTRSGYVLGPDQRATVMEGLYAITQGAAYQYFEEDEKGSITPGKRADFVILGENPLAADPDALKDIPILETIARGRTVYKR
ncbi:MAG: amidohydrolase family protein [Amphiplicatus sp.]